MVLLLCGWESIMGSDGQPVLSQAHTEVETGMIGFAPVFRTRAEAAIWLRSDSFEILEVPIMERDV